MIAFGTDFDDTLYFHDQGGLRKKDLEAIDRFRKAGGRFGLVSGRSLPMWKGLEEMIEGKAEFDFHIFANGACLCDQNRQILWQTFLPKDVVEEIFEKGQQAGIPLILHGENTLYFTADQSEVEGERVDSLEDFDPERIYAMSFDNYTEEGRRFFEMMKDYDKAVLVSNSRFADFHPLGVSKGAALNRLVEMLYGKEAVSAAIGDSYNDLSMLEQADLSFTFPSSPKPVRKAAGYLVDGIHEAVDLLLDGKIPLSKKVR